MNELEVEDDSVFNLKPNQIFIYKPRVILHPAKLILIMDSNDELAT